MSDMPNGAAAAAPEAPVAPETSAPTEFTEHEVAGVLAGLLDRPDPDEGDTQESAPAEGEDAAAEESPPSGDDPDGQAEAQEAASIAPPSGWTAKDREVWQSLPPAVQDVIRRRDSEMAGAISRAQTERAQIEQAVHAQLDVVQQDRSQYVQNLAAFRDVLLPGARELDQVDWQRLSTDNPAEYVRLSAVRDAMQQRLGWISSEVGRVQQQQQQEQAQRQEQAKRYGYERLVQARPEFADPAKAQKIGSELGSYLRSKGFSDAEITGVTDHRAIDLALSAMEAEQATAARVSANSKRAPTPAPQVQRPGSSQRQDSDRAGHRMTQLASRFDRSRSVNDAAAIVAEWLNH